LSTDARLSRLFFQGRNCSTFLNQFFHIFLSPGFWIYDTLKPYAEQLVMGHPAKMKAITAGKKKSSRSTNARLPGPSCVLGGSDRDCLTS
jgi:hypothetical protein